MRVLHIMSSCSRGSGVAQVVMRYFRNIYQKVTFDFLVYWESEESMRGEIEALGGRVFVIPQPGLRSMGQYKKRFDAFLRDHKGEYAAVHLHELYLSAIYYDVARRHGIRARIAHAHTTKFSEYPLKDLRNRVLFLPARWMADAYLACSQAAGEAIFGKTVCRRKRFQVLKNGSDLGGLRFSRQTRDCIRAQLGLEDCFVVGHIGRFSPQKNHGFLLDIFYEVQKLRPDARLLLVGAGNRMEEMKQKAQSLGMEDRVIFTGSRTDVGDLLSAMDVFVFPSVFEGLGIALVEAQSNGLPCFASDVVPKDAYVLPNCHAMSLKAAPRQWAQAVAEADTTRIPDAMEQVARAGFDISREAEALVDFYEKL